MTADRLIEQLSTARRAARLTRLAVAERVGVSAAAVGQWEAGASRPALDTAVRWARALGCEITVTAPGTPGLLAWAGALPADVAEALTLPEENR